MRISTLVLTLSMMLMGHATTQTAAAQAVVSKRFTYQGYLERSGTPYTGTATVNFALCTQATGLNTRDVATYTNVQFTNGQFTVLVDFGETDLLNAPIYDGRELYLEVSVDTGSGVTRLTPRQLVQPAPYALSMPNVITRNGNVGIGNTNPTNTLDISDNETGLLALRGSSPFGTSLSLINSTAGGDAWALISTGASNGEGAGKLMISDQVPRMTIDTNGNVGIGTVNPTRKLEVNGSASVGGTFLAAGMTSVGTLRYASDFTANPARTFDIVSGAAIDLIGNSDIYMNSRGGRKHLLFNVDAGAGNVGIGTIDPTEKLHVNGNIRAKVIIIEGGADLAESYDVSPAGDVKPMPGMVVSIDPDRVGKLRIASGTYDRTVAGIISGADGIAPGLVLGQKGTVADGEHPIANAGRVWCYVDADAGGAVSAGDLLTTSSTPGHAMKVSDHTKGSGATLGKAMSKLESGKGLVLVLVTLQ
jgi:hypothetical protein